MTKRTDVHAPSRIMPEDYRYMLVESRDNNFSTGSCERKAFQDHMTKTGATFSTHDHGGGCMVCGAWMIDYAIFYHIPSNEYIVTGCDCANKIDGGHADDFRRVAQMRRAAAKRAVATVAAAKVLEDLGMLDAVEAMFADAEIGGKVVNWDVPAKTEMDVEREHLALLIGSEVAYALPKYLVARTTNDFFTIVEMVRNLVKYGKWSDKQVNYVKVLMAKLAELPVKVLVWKKEDEKRADAPEGKLEIVGKVLSLKTTNSDWGMVVKMLVEHESGYKVWSTVPAAINPDKGDVVKFTATLKRSQDPKFAYASRPSKASVV